MTIAQQLNIKEFPFEIMDKNGKLIYFENSDGLWYKWNYDSKNNTIYYGDSTGYWSKREYDSNNNRVYTETSSGFWLKREFDSIGKQIYYEDSIGTIIDNRPKELTNAEIADKLEEIVKLLKSKS